jgi:metal-responsive CopG/Arc/MetJ family transcriptional regulator
MVRIQIQLTEEQARALKDVAAREGVSMAELIRRAVDRIIGESDDRQQRRRARALQGKYRDGATDVATNHDSYLDEIYGESVR